MLDFDDNAWESAGEYSENDVHPHDGHDRIDWINDAQQIWVADL